MKSRNIVHTADPSYHHSQSPPVSIPNGQLWNLSHIELKNRCNPRSLACLVRIFQYLGISLGGIDPKLLGQQELSHGALHRWPYRWLSIGWNVFCVLSIHVAIVDYLFLDQDNGYRGFMGELYNSKPILRVLINSVVYMYALNNLFLWIYYSFVGSAVWQTDGASGCRGGRPLIVHLSNFGPQNRDLNLGIFWPIFIKILASFLVFYIGICVSVRLGSESKSTSQLAWLTLQTVRKRLPQIHSGCVLLFQMAIFIYVSDIYRRQIEQFRSEPEFNTLSTRQLIEMRFRLVQLEQHYCATVHHLQLPLVASVLSSTCILIGSLCMLLIIDGLRSIQFIGYLAMIMFESLVQLMVCIFYGDRVHQEYQHLLDHIRARVQDWNSLNLLYFQRLAISSSHFDQFRFRLYRTFRLNQTLLISISTFILNYIVLLIQTDHSKPKDGAMVNRSG